MYDFGSIILAPLILSSQSQLIVIWYNVHTMSFQSGIQLLIQPSTKNIVFLHNTFILTNLVSNLDARGLCCIAGEKVEITDKIHYKIAI
uniref:Uncharacterized protein n=1 Tax=Wolbachia endosymbiont of Aleurodicus floccissimus TaxID=2152762 RepID=A0A3B0J0R2_9RICK